MKLVYHQGKNFGDALNPLILNRILPDFFDNKEKEIFLGIGSIIGLKQHLPQKKIVFTSGYAAGDESTYGHKPVINESWDIQCVRGPLTAKILGLDQDLVVADGAILLNRLYERQNSKKYKFSYMPHHVSLNMYSHWKSLLEQVNINLIDPRDDVNKILDQIDSSENLITEAMHGAIVADAFRIPWCGVKAYPYINEFKWDDWAASLDMEVNLLQLPSLHDSMFFQEIIHKKSRSLIKGQLLNMATKFVINRKESKFLEKLERIKKNNFRKSDEHIIIRKCDQLLQIASEIKMKYK